MDIPRLRRETRGIGISLALKGDLEARGAA
jgi:hypothetical protein